LLPLWDLPGVIRNSRRDLGEQLGFRGGIKVLKYLCDLGWCLLNSVTESRKTVLLIPKCRWSFELASIPMTIYRGVREADANSKLPMIVQTCVYTNDHLSRSQGAGANSKMPDDHLILRPYQRPFIEESGSWCQFQNADDHLNLRPYQRPFIEESGRPTPIPKCRWPFELASIPTTIYRGVNSKVPMVIWTCVYTNDNLSRSSGGWW